MVISCHRPWLALAAGVGLLAGCASGPRAKSPETGADAGQPRAAVDTGRDVNDKQVLAHAHYAQAMIYDLDEQAELAEQEFARAADLDPANTDLVLELSHRYLQEKAPEKALTLLKKASTLPDAPAPVFATLGLVYSRLGKDDQAITATQTAIKRDPRLLAGYQNLFIIRLQKNQVQEALKLLDQAAKVSGTDAEFLVDLGGLYVNLQRQAPQLKAAAAAAGKEVLGRAAKEAPDNPRLALRLADNLDTLGDTTNAAHVYLDLLQKYGELPSLRSDIHSKLADIYLRDHNQPDAKAQLEAILHDDPANAQAYYLLGSLSYEGKKFDEAVDYFKKAVLLNEDFAEAYYDLAGAQINADKAPDALTTLERARTRFAPTFGVEFLTALAYMKQKDYTNAVQHFNAADVIGRTSESNRLTGYFYFEAGAASERKGDLDQAELYFEKSLKLEPEASETLNYYGYMLADKGVKLELARKMIEKAVQLEPTNGAFLDSLGWVLFKQGQAEQGLVQIRKAIELTEPPDATVFDHLGEIYAALKQPDKAREAWQKSLSLEPNDEIRKKLQRVGGGTWP